MLKEDLIRHLRICAIIIVTTFIVMVVSLLVEFGFIANYHSEIRKLEQRNEEINQEIENISKEIEYLKNEGKEDQSISNSNSGDNPK